VSFFSGEGEAMNFGSNLELTHRATCGARKHHNQDQLGPIRMPPTGENPDRAVTEMPLNALNGIFIIVQGHFQ